MGAPVCSEVVTWRGRFGCPPRVGREKRRQAPGDPRHPDGMTGSDPKAALRFYLARARDALVWKMDGLWGARSG